MEAPKQYNTPGEQLLYRLMSLLSDTKSETKSELFISKITNGPFVKLLVSHNKYVNTLTNGKVGLEEAHRLEVERLLRGFTVLKGCTTIMLDNDTVVIEQI